MLQGIDILLRSNSIFDEQSEVTPATPAPRSSYCLHHRSSDIGGCASKMYMVVSCRHRSGRRCNKERESEGACLNARGRGEIKTTRNEQMGGLTRASGKANTRVLNLA